ncbi:rhodanese-like domain-containing protein [Amphritea sp. HPY]|uniref:rhodanese-like domain-containing protein n=1 Tax=Amphritea sp. HPY TaxID=3421652 RepID=UPI003D7E9EAF
MTRPFRQIIRFALSLLALLALSSFSYAELKGVTPTQLQEMIDRGVPVIDIRTPQEWQQTGIIPESKTLMFFDSKGNYDTASWLASFRQLVADENQPFVLVCRSGNRTGKVGTFLADQMKMSQVYHLKGGINDWRRQQLQVTAP